MSQGRGESKTPCRRRRVLFVTTAIARSGAGLYEAVSGLARRICAPTSGAEVVLVSVTGRSLTPEERADWSGVTIVSEPARSRLAGVRSLHRMLERLPADEFDLIHAHGLWDGAAVASAAWAVRNEKPFVLSPHGMLDPWSFGHKRYKKALPWLLWERNAVCSATVIESKSRKEARNVLRHGFRNPLAVIPIGLDGFPTPPAKPSRVNQRTCVLLARIHPVKAIENLIEAWAALRPRGWTLLIAGPDGGDYQRTLERLVQENALADTVRFVGPVFGESKWSLLQSADLFVLPSYSENFGVVVVEALSQSVPVITTTATPWEDLQARKCGWQVEPTAPGIQSALEDAVASTPEQLRRMGINGRHYVDECFRWDVIVRDTLDLYAWACGDGPKPPTLFSGPSIDSLSR